ncbi:MAG: FAD:protein FMN transferase [Archangiaceae bacterium]|nr:FAD:protein FMN transferase [Archangiaceae bacterium]
MLKPARALAALGVVAASVGHAEVVRQDRSIMHTTVTVVLADAVDAGVQRAAFDEAFAVFTDIDANLNEWKPDSALGRINAAAGKEAVRAPPDVCEVVRAALEGARRTRGLFDPTWASLRELWKFSDTEPGQVPDREAVKQACSNVAWKKVEVKPVPHATDGSCLVRLPQPGMKLGLGGLVKGWGIDRAAKGLRARGLKNFFIQAGGDLYFAGTKQGQPWTAGIRDPRGAPDQIFAKLEVKDRSFSTSGDYEHFFVADGVRYHHIIDLRDCWPARASRSVTVLARTATDAELLTKSAFVLGGREGLKLVESMGALAVIVGSDNTVYVSKGLEQQLVGVEPTP